MAAGTIAERYLKMAYGVEIVAFVSSVGKVHIPDSNGDDDLLSEDYLKLLHGLTREKVDENTVRCPHQETAELMEEVRLPSPARSVSGGLHNANSDSVPQRIHEAKANNDSIGGTVTCVIKRSPVGLGEPVFDKLEAKLAHAMLSIPATKGFEIGSGFKGCEMPGSEHNDAFMQKEDGRLGTKTNRSGGIQGGITNGEDIYFKSVLLRAKAVRCGAERARRCRIAFKSPATISQEQSTATYAGKAGVLATRGRHDPCVVPRYVWAAQSLIDQSAPETDPRCDLFSAVPIVEAMAALVIMECVRFTCWSQYLPSR